ncbi:nicotinate-nucleotide adenylyltransferase [Dyella thiooxydans]|uniref:Probable nicotinate-nucleotide adenylyltransferase n=1 Tax=Dyella thiooxydans TaxID=445710 RepID=A0A160N1S6_9GAMM|nr:nicotinate-nucleotide adenylyltransferase [Dyella thiooxydans]AND69162.1 nicotinate-nucleotide adenylyltransferase [Dyella thiooxydans]
MKPLAILGGTFDPVHIGHLCVAWEASELLDAEVRLMPAGVPPHRTPPVASAEQRVALLRAALAGQDRLQLDPRELGRDGPSYSVDTLEALRAEQGDRPLVLLMGADAFASLPSWHRWSRLFELAHLGVFTRPGFKAAWPADLDAAITGRLVDPAGDWYVREAGSVLQLEVTPLEISATRIRRLLAEGRVPRYLLPEGVFDVPGWLEVYRRSPG